MRAQGRFAGSIVVAAAMGVAALAMTGPVHATGVPVPNSLQDVFTPGTFTTPSARITDHVGDLLTLQAAPIGQTASEPTIGVGPDGTAYFAGSTLVVDRPQVWGVAQTHVMRSDDGGLTWARKQQGVPATDVSITPGNLDPFVWVDPATGRVFSPDLYGGCSWMNFSDDRGDTWLSNPVACGTPVNDHQTIGAGVPRGGYTTRLYPNIVYYCANQIVDTACGRSLDGGLVWTPTLSAPYPLVGGTSGCGGLSGHLRSDPDGRIVIPSSECVAISDDAGDTWTRVKATPLESPIPHTSVATDAAGNLYFVSVAVVEAGTYDQWLPFLTISRDHGATWSAPIRISPPDVKHANFPVVTAGDEGRIAISFPGSAEPKGTVKATTWNQYVVVTEDALAENPVFLSATGNDPADPIHRGICRGRCDGLWDFLDVTVSPAGQAWASASDDCVAACNTGTLVSAHVGDGIAIRQIGGPSLRD